MVGDEDSEHLIVEWSDGEYIQHVVYEQVGKFDDLEKAQRFV